MTMHEVTMHEVTMKDGSVELIDGTDAYQQEGPMTTFFRIASSRHVVDTWSTRVASFRTSEIMTVRRLSASSAELERSAPLRSA